MKARDVVGPFFRGLGGYCYRRFSYVAGASQCGPLVSSVRDVTFGVNVVIGRAAINERLRRIAVSLQPYCRTAASRLRAHFDRCCAAHECLLSDMQEIKRTISEDDRFLFCKP
ncbi:hypothetical protein D1822_08740 [Phaeobacter inhibens]|nr:hypothetical protein PGA1_c17590 [Phaeobacter inhibens DSM 17395]AUQ46123.1 hypothetical protein PhaeoP10_01785 [Phaeobacter inhibens]AXT22908.1 hypothetical protein D1822_08740 [Phaeobacter inhibens]